jgi:predicted  nucleic acid-binding Zn-ribbon protein
MLNVSPSHDNREETLSTLRFGRQAKRIVNRPHVNKDMSPAELTAILHMRDAEIARLRAQLSKTSPKFAEFAAAEQAKAAAAEAFAASQVEEIERLTSELSAANKRYKELEESAGKLMAHHVAYKESIEAALGRITISVDGLREVV